MRYADIFRTLILSTGLLFLVSGCGESDSLGRYPISGSVTLDGAPVNKGSIAFQPTSGGATSSGASIEAGKYAIPAAQGLPPGTYRVVINSSQGGGDVPAGELPGETPAGAKELIPAKWNVDSKETIEVKDGAPTEYNFDIKSK